MAKSTLDDIKTLIEQFDQSDWKEVHVKTDNFELYLSDNPNSSGPTLNSLSQTATTAAGNTVSTEAEEVKPISAQSIVPEGMYSVIAPNLGTFYSAPKPGAAAYVEIGQTVTSETEVCLIEVMKLFTPVKAGVSGTIKEICVSDGQMVEYEQLLIIIEPN